MVVCRSKVDDVSADDGAQYRAALGEWSQFNTKSAKWVLLDSLTFTTIPKIVANPTLDRRTNMIARLEEQKLLLNDPNYIRTTRTWVKMNGKLTPIDRQHRILP